MLPRRRILVTVGADCKKFDKCTILFLLQVVLHPQIQREKQKMKRFVIAVALACVLSGTAMAGEIHSVGAAAPPPPPASGEIPSTGVQASPPPEASSPVLTVLLIIINAVAG